MKVEFHRAITGDALNSFIRPEVLNAVISANIGQDALRYQIGHDHFHYDNNAFAAGDAYLTELRQVIFRALQQDDAALAHTALGRLTHTVQDFYAHSNYIALWRERFPGATPAEMSSQEAEILQDPRLRSGRLYYPLEALSFIPRFRRFVLPLLPRDSHAWMNIDDPSRPDFDYAYSAAVKRSRFEFENVCKALNSRQLELFTGANLNSSI